LKKCIAENLYVLMILQKGHFFHHWGCYFLPSPHKHTLTHSHTQIREWEWDSCKRVHKFKLKKIHPLQTAGTLIINNNFHSLQVQFNEF
jgi:hypothetical protein